MKGYKLTIAVTGIHLGENCQPGPGVARAIREALGNDVRIIGLAYDVWDSSLHSEREFDDGFLMPYPSVGPQEYLARLREIDDLCGLDVLIPCLDVELPVLQCLTRELREAKIAAVLPSRASLNRRAKHQLPQLAKEVGVKVPETMPVVDALEVMQAVKTLGLPLVVKGPHYDAEVVQSVDAAIAAFNRLLAAWGGPILLQKFVRGEEYNVAAVRDDVSGNCASVTMHKTLITRLGKAWAGVTIDDPEIRVCSDKLISGLNWSGGCEVELLKDQTGQLYLIEFNPRLPAWNYLSAAAGVNLPFELLQLALGRRMDTAAKARSGIYYVRHAAELVGDISNIAAVVSTGRRWETNRSGNVFPGGRAPNAVTLDASPSARTDRNLHEYV